MAEHADTPELTDPATACVSQPPAESEADSSAKGEGRRPNVGVALAAGTVIMLALGGLVGWLAVAAHGASQTGRDRDLFLAAARQAAINLTTISYAEADTDVDRILDSATGALRDEFQHRAQPFVDVVMQTQSTTKGTVTSAGIQSQAVDKAQVIVAVSVMTSSKASPEQQGPRSWRMKINLEKTADGVKASDVQFVP
jgi:Mce-associated membrane protein